MAITKVRNTKAVDNRFERQNLMSHKPEERKSSPKTPESMYSSDSQPDDLQEVFTMITDRLEKKFEDKKRKLQSSADENFNRLSKQLSEQILKQQSQFEDRMDAFANQATVVIAEFQDTLKRLQSEHEVYKKTQSTLMNKLSTSIASQREIYKHGTKGLQQLDMLGKQKMTELQKKVEHQMNRAQERINGSLSMQTPSPQNQLKKSLLKMLA